MTDKYSLKILLIDDHVMFTDGLTSLLQEHNNIGLVQNAANASDALELILNDTFDLIVTDLCLPGMNGIELIKRIKKQGVNTPILVLSMHLGKELTKEILAVGAEGYLTKNAHKKEFYNAVELLTSGGSYYGNKITEIMMDLINSKQQSIPDTKTEFTPREREVLHFICKEYSSKQIADHMCIGLSTVETYRRSLFKKTSSHNVIGLIRYAVQNDFALWR